MFLAAQGGGRPKRDTARQAPGTLPGTFEFLTPWFFLPHPLTQLFKNHLCARTQLFVCKRTCAGETHTSTDAVCAEGAS